MNPPEARQAGGFTEFYVETENITGDVESTYPSQFSPGETRTLPVGITNQERSSVTYRVLVFEQRTGGDDGEASASEQSRLAHRTVSLDHGEARTLSLPVSPTMTGTDLRLLVLLYEEDLPAEPTPETAYRTLRLPIDVTDDGESEGA